MVLIFCFYYYFIQFFIFFGLSLLLCIVAPHHHVLLSFPCFSLLGVIVSRCHTLLLFIATRHNYSSSPFVSAIVLHHYALLMFPSLLCIVLAIPFVVVHCYCCSSSQCVNVVPHRCALLLLLFVNMRYYYCSLSSCAIAFHIFIGMCHYHSPSIFLICYSFLIPPCYATIVPPCHPCGLAPSIWYYPLPLLFCK